MISPERNVGFVTKTKKQKKKKKKKKKKRKRRKRKKKNKQETLSTKLFQTLSMAPELGQLRSLKRRLGTGQSRHCCKESD